MPPELPKKGTGKFYKQGQTAAPLYGNDPTVEGTAPVKEEPRELGGS